MRMIEILVVAMLMVGGFSTQAQQVFQWQSTANDLFGLKDINGNVVVQPTYQWLWVEGDYVFVESENGLGLMDNTGKLILPPQFDWITQAYAYDDANFDDVTNYFWVADHSGKIGFAGLNGMITDFKYDDYYHFDGYYGGNAVVLIDDANEKYGMIDQQGNEILPCNYSDIQYADEPEMGYFHVSDFDDDGDWRMGVVDFSGNVLLEPIYDDLYLEFEPIGGGNSIAFIEKDGLMGMIDQDFNILMNCEFEYIDWISEKHLAASFGEDREGLYALDGTVLFAPTDVYFNEFSDGMAAFEQGEHSGYVNEKGKIVINPQYSWADEFLNGRAVVEKTNGNYAVINKKGKELYACNDCYYWNSADVLFSFMELEDGSYKIENENGEDVIGFPIWDYDLLSDDIAIGYSDVGELIITASGQAFETGPGVSAYQIEEYIYNNGLDFFLRDVVEITGQDVEPTKVVVGVEMVNFNNEVIGTYTDVFLWQFQDQMETEAAELIPVYNDTLMGLIDNHGHTILPCEYQLIALAYDWYWDIRTEFLTVMKDGKFGICDFEGNILLPIEYDRLFFDYWYECESGVAWVLPVMKDGKMGLIGPGFETLIAPVYDDVRLWNYCDYGLPVAEIVNYTGGNPEDEVRPSIMGLVNYVTGETLEPFAEYVELYDNELDIVFAYSNDEGELGMATMQGPITEPQFGWWPYQVPYDNNVLYFSMENDDGYIAVFDLTGKQLTEWCEMALIEEYLPKVYKDDAWWYVKDGEYLPAD